MKSLISDLRSIAQLIVTQPVLALVAVLAVAFALGADSATFNKLDASFSRVVTYTGPAGKPGFAGEIQPNLEPASEPAQPVALEAVAQENPAPAPVPSKISASKSSSQPDGRGAYRPEASRSTSKGHSHAFAASRAGSFEVDLSVIPAIAVQGIQNLQAARWNGKPLTDERQLATLLGPDLSKMIADKAKMRKAGVDPEKADSANSRKLIAKARAEFEALAHKFAAHPVPVRVSCPSPSYDRNEGGR